MLRAEQGPVSTPTPGCPGWGDKGVTPRVGKNRGAGEKRLKEKRKKKKEKLASQLRPAQTPGMAAGATLALFDFDVQFETNQ